MNIAASLSNCHVKGLDSLVYKACPHMIRVFVAREDHELWKNDGEHEMSIAFHPHHCGITMVPLFGEVDNLFHRTSINAAGAYRYTPLLELAEFRYHSQITGGHGGFERSASPIFTTLAFRRLSCPLTLSARTEHTVYVPKGRTAAWMIIEGQEDPDYLNVAYSNADLSTFDASGLYLPMSPERAAEDQALLQAHGIWL